MQYCLSGKERKVSLLNKQGLYFSIFLDITNKDIRDANNVHTDSDDEGESMDW